MSQSLTSPLRLGIVPFLNVQPLIWSLRDHPRVHIVASAPRQLAAELERGKHDVAIVPVFEYLRHPVLYTIVPGVSIAARDEVYSVLLFSSVPLERVDRVYLDSASLTSVNLIRVLLAERGLRPEYVEMSTTDWKPGAQLPPGTAALLIGDPAILERGKHPHQYDLQVLWKQLTGLPFVFAAWLVHPNAENREIAGLLQAAKDYGLQRLEEIAREAGPRFGVPPAEALRYFRENLWYELAEQELAGWRRFAELCVKHSLARQVPQFRLHNR